MAPTSTPIDLSPTEDLMIAIIHAVFIILGVVPNCVVFMTLLKDTRFLREPKNLIIFIRALADGLQSATICPMPFASAIVGHWTTGFTGCVVYAFATSWLGLTAIHLNALMVYERWYALSMIPPRMMAEQFTYLAIFACFAASFIVSCFPLIGWSEYDYEAFGYHCSVKWYGMDWNHASFTLFLMTFFYVLPVSIILVTGWKIYQRVRQLRRTVRESLGSDSHLTKVTYQVQMKATRIVVVMVAGFLAAWTPYGILALYSMNNKAIATVVSGIPSIVAKSALVYNPIIYLFMCRKLRRKSLRTVQGFLHSVTAANMDIFEMFCKRDASQGSPVVARRGVMVFPETSALEKPSSSNTDDNRPRRSAWIDDEFLS